ncbi:MAG: hypothetical protein H8E66_11400 [Planctomycetes bacterium]|nr:hypothetical protein [Planctomycetota bacterium]
MPSERDKAKRERIIQLVAGRLGVPPDQIAQRLSFIEDLDVDSLDVEELAIELEEEFG